MSPYSDALHIGLAMICRWDRVLQSYANGIGICSQLYASGIWICSHMQAGYGFAIICTEERDLQWYASEIGPDRDLQWYASGIGIFSDMQAGWGFAVICKRDRNSSNAGTHHQLAWGYPRVAAGCNLGSGFGIIHGKKQESELHPRLILC